MTNDKSFITNHIREFWSQNQLILDWFASLRNFGTIKSDKVLTEIYF